jgi:phage gp45-like
MMDELRKFYNKILMKIFYLMARGEVIIVDNTKETQRIHQGCLSDEYVTDIERFENYGMTSYPLYGAESFSLFTGGNRDQGIVLCVHDSRYRPTDLSIGDVCIYTYIDKVVAHRILLRALDGSIQISGNVNVTGNIVVSGNVSDSSGIAQTMAAMRSKYNAHTHNGGVPVPSAGEQM